MTTTRTAPAVSEPTTPIKPSEALRLGRLTRPVRLTGTLFGRPVPTRDGACALGAIAVGYGHVTGSVYDILDRVLPRDIPGWISYYNDTLDWTDAQIIAWLEGQGL